MLQAMRQNMKVILWITVIFFVLLIFLVWGADLQFGSAPQPNVAGLVNGEPVSASTYQQLLAINRQDAQAQGRDLEPSDELRIAEQTWNSLVNEILLKQEAARRGLQARDSEVRAILLNDPPALITQNPSFQNVEGRFDMAAYRAFLQNPATPEAILVQLESYVRDGLPQQKLQQMVLSGAKIPEDELRRSYREEAETASISYVLVDALRMRVDPTVTDEDVATYYGAHPSEFQEPKRVDLLYHSVPRVPTAADSAGLREEIADFAAEARRAAAAEREGAENLRDSELATLASTFSDLPFAENGGLDSTYKDPARMSARVQAAVAGLDVGGISDPFEDAGYYRVVQVVDRKEENGETLVQLRQLGLRIAPSDSTVSAVEEELESIRERALTSGLEEALGVDVKKAERVVREGLVPGLTGLPQAAEFAHTNPTGTVSRVLATNGAWFILEVGEVHPPGVPPLPEVHNRVVNAVLSARRMEAARAEADRLAQRLRDGETLEAAATDTLTVTVAENLTRRGGVVGLGRDPQVLGAVFTLPPGQVSAPLEAARGYVLLRVDSRPEVDWTAYESRKQFLMQIQRSTRQSQILNAFLEDLRRNAEIVDYRT
jgi:parvulin-like peptidyl-prolyl isomerase